MILFKYDRKLIHKDYFASIVQSFDSNASNDQQPRHLKDDGWDVLGSDDILRNDTYDLKGNLYKANAKLPSGMYMLYIGSLCSEFKTTHTRKLGVIGKLTISVWNKLCNMWNHCCSFCGQKCNKLQKGHLDPNQPLLGNNVVPMCSSCNNWVRNDWTLHQDKKVRCVFFILIMRSFLMIVPIV